MKNWLLPVAFATIVVYGIALFPVTDYDIWFHLAEGKVMVDEHAFPYVDRFSYTAPGAPSYPNSWLFTVAAYTATKYIGLDGFNIIKASAVAGMFLLMCWHFARYHWLNYGTIVGLVAALFVIREELSVRPHTFAYVLFVLFLAYLLRYRESRDRYSLFALGCIELIWVNTHASFIWGVALTCIFLLVEGIRARSINKSDVQLAGLISIASLGHWFYGYTYLVRIVYDWVAPASALPIRETMPAGLDALYSVQGIVILAVFFAIVWASVRRKDWTVLSSTAVFGYLALSAVRFTKDLLLFLLMMVPLYKDQLTILFRSFQGLTARIKPMWFYGALVVLLLVAKNSSLGAFRLGLESFTYPVQAVEFIKNNHILEQTNGNLYHTYNFGGYLMWALPKYKVFIDGRGRPYHGDIINRYWDNFTGGKAWQDTVDRYHITAALMTIPHAQGGTVYNNSSAMFPKEIWALVYMDDVAAIYVRRMPKLADFIATREYRFIDPQKIDITYLSQKITNQETYDQAVVEVQKALVLNPDSYRLHFTLAYLYATANHQPLAKQELERVVSINPFFGPAKQILSQLAL